MMQIRFALAAATLLFAAVTWAAEASVSRFLCSARKERFCIESIYLFSPQLKQ